MGLSMDDRAAAVAAGLDMTGMTADDVRDYLAKIRAGGNVVSLPKQDGGTVDVKIPDSAAGVVSELEKVAAKTGEVSGAVADVVRTAPPLATPDITKAQVGAFVTALAAFAAAIGVPMDAHVQDALVAAGTALPTAWVVADAVIRAFRAKHLGKPRG